MPCHELTVFFFFCIVFLFQAWLRSNYGSPPVIPLLCVFIVDETTKRPKLIWNLHTQKNAFECDKNPFLFETSLMLLLRLHFNYSFYRWFVYSDCKPLSWPILYLCTSTVFCPVMNYLNTPRFNAKFNTRPSTARVRNQLKQNQFFSLYCILLFLLPYQQTIF